MEEYIFDPTNFLAISLLEKAGMANPTQQTIDIVESILSHAFTKRRLIIESLLNEQEGLCLFWAAKGKTIHETAKLTNMEPRSVRLCRNSIKRKLNACSIAQAVFEGMRFGCLP